MGGTKLIPNLNDKEHYIVHYRNLKLYLKLGLKLRKVHKILMFEQSPWLKPYIEFNTNQRKNCSSAFERDFFKLMNNAVFGKTMENLRARIDVRLVNDEKIAKKCIASPAFQSFSIFNNDLVAVKMQIKTLTLNRPVYARFSILDISKTLMYQFHYDFMKMKYGKNVHLLFTDTDSLCYEISCQDFYHDMLKDLHMYDTSDYPTEHPLHSQANKKVIGKMKDELNGNIAIEFIGLKSKMYSLKTELFEKKTAKGVLKPVIQRDLKHEDYRNCLFGKKLHRHNMIKIESRKHHLSTILLRKVSLSH
ncbi:uncharacterized protein LOC118206056 [Stegodyphus dumicola]|uniref:uncharacterized protein LOC118206056 n=1 Tax=Stegodyphus dumicola TaxID=202533 RepID=UPI0015AE4B49|nr:uncharacterized protein LOC118206056 [Stegodyphus dumicola]